MKVLGSGKIAAGDQVPWPMNGPESLLISALPHSPPVLYFFFLRGRDGGGENVMVEYWKSTFSLLIFFSVRT